MTQPDGPILLPLTPPSETRRGLAYAVTAGLASLLSGAAKAADLKPLDPDELLHTLRRRLYEADQAKRRARWIGGRLVNRLAGERPDYSAFPGRHCRQILEAAGEDSLDDILRADRSYLLRIDILRRAHSRLLEPHR